MKEIRMVDLKGQYEKIAGDINLGIQEVIESSTFINGPAVKHFQINLEQYLGVKHVIPCANGTDALQVAMMALDLQPGDEVITASFTFVATVEVIALLKLKPVLVEVDPRTFNLDPESVRKAITSRTKAIVPVHLFGQCADMDAIMDIAREHHLYVIEDACQAIGANHYSMDGQSRHAGAIGHIGCTSFFPSKNLGCYGDGGALFTNDDNLAEKLRHIVNHGMKVRYYHDSIGVNSRLDSIQAAVLDVKLRHLDEYTAARQAAASFYDESLSGIEGLRLPARADFSDHVFHQYTLQIHHASKRDGLREFLESKGIPAMVYYPVPMHLQKAYANPQYREGDFPVTEKLSQTVISLPMHTELDQDQLSYICNNIKEYLSR
jgi:UDP-2-acetamido-2-deoxy-ribo-hexuluronate aminotransferase